MATTIQTKEQRSSTRYPTSDRTQITVSFEHKSGKFSGSLWDYSRYGLGVFLDHSAKSPPKTSTIDNIQITAFGETRWLGSGRVARRAEDNEGLFIGLMLLDDLIDLDSLIHHKQFRLLKDEIEEVKSSVSEFSSIAPEFKSFASDFAAGLAAFKRKFDTMDLRFQSEPPSMKKNLFRIIEGGVGTELHQFMDRKIEELSGVANGSHSKESHGHYLRTVLWPYIELAPFIHRSVVKPRGYAGDSTMMEMVYKNGYDGASSFAKFLNRHTLGIPSANAVRNRRGLIISLIEECIEKNLQKEANVLSIACGPAREMKEYLSESKYAEQTNLFLLDQDMEALKEARENVMAGGRDPDSDRVHFIDESVRTMIKGKLPAALAENKFVFIYSMGLFDYLTMAVSTALVTRLYDLLQPGGEMVIGNYTVESPDRFYMDCILDWPLLYKSESDMLDMAEKLPASAQRSIGYEESGVQMFLRVVKPVQP